MNLANEVQEEELVIEVINDEKQAEFYNQLDNLNPEKIDEESGLEDAVSKIQPKDSMPSSMGLTFCLSRDTKSFTVKFKGGIYEKHKIYADIVHKDEDDNKQKEYKFDEYWWLRTSVFAEKEIELSGFEEKKVQV